MPDGFSKGGEYPGGTKLSGRNNTKIKCHLYLYTNQYPHSHPDRNSYPHRDGNSHSHFDRNSHPHRNSYKNEYADRYPNSYTREFQDFSSPGS